MAREVLVIEYCDWCLGDDNDRREATWSKDVTVDGITRNLALCTDHLAAPGVRLLTELARYGTKTGTQPSDDGPPPPGFEVFTRRGSGRRPKPPGEGDAAAECPRCHQVYRSRERLGNHGKRHHGVGIRTLDAEAGHWLGRQPMRTGRSQHPALPAPADDAAEPTPADDAAEPALVGVG